MRKNKRITLVVFLSVFILIGLFSCTQNNPMTPGNMPSGTGGTPGNGTLATNIVTISSFTFSPTPITINKGTYIKWKNNDSVSHSSTADGAQWDTGLISGGGGISQVIAFTQTGTFGYHCRVHPSMTGSIVVQ